MAHKGLREWTGEEGGSLFLGQNGFHVITNEEMEAVADKGIAYWVAFKAVNGTATVKAQSYNDGDDFSQNGLYSGTAIGMADGDIVYGAFDKITVASGDHVIAYIGR